MSLLIVIEPFDAIRHSKKLRNQFSCGDPILDSYIKKQAKQDIKRRISHVYIASAKTTNQATNQEDQQQNPILGFYTLSTTSINLAQLPPNKSNKLPKHPIPAALIGRLAVNQSFQGQGIGRRLLADAVKRTLAVSQQIGIYALVVDAIDTNAYHFYQTFGFKPLKDKQRLFLQLRRLA